MRPSPPTPIRASLCAGITPFLLVMCALVGQTPLHATVEYGAVNHITRECGVIEDGSWYDEPIGWHSCGKECYEDTAAYCRRMGYRYVGRNITCAVETALAIIVVTIVIGVLIVVRYVRRRRLR